MLTVGVVLLCWTVILTLFLLARRRWVTRSRSRDRLGEGTETEPEATSVADEAGFLTRWLALAGYRGRGAAMSFTTVTLLLLGLGATGAYGLASSGMMHRARRLVEHIPGGVGDIFLPFVVLAPWLLVVVLASVPWVRVRAARRRRAQAVEQDLPITLELLATLGEAGLGFDAALERILSTQSPDRPLAQELRTFQLEILAGRRRVQCLRRLARRLEVTALTVFISAMVQADQVGAGIADVLRRQSDDLRGRRREDALTRAASLPVKLLFPLIICFLPGVITAALGPPFYQIFQMMETTFNKGIRR